MYDKDKLRAVPIVEVAEKLNIATKRNGSVLLMHCLWHEDKKPSMVLGGRYNRCHCFACGADHDAVGLVMKAHNINFKEACEWLEREGYEIRTASPPTPSSSAPTERSATLRDVERSHEARGNPFGGRKNVSKIQRLEALQAKPSGAPPQPSPHGAGVVTTLSDSALSARKANLPNTPPMRGEMEGGSRIGGAVGLYFLPSFLERHISMDNSFAICLRKVFGEEAAAEVVRLYRLGTLPAFDRYDDVMFPSIDIHGNIHDIKIQAYECDERSDRFFHSNKDVCYWLKRPLSNSPEGENSDVTLSDSALSDSKAIFYSPPPARLCRFHSDSGERMRGEMEGGSRKAGGLPLFGEHLLSLYPSKTVVLVESPKNACVGAAVYPQYLWVATGNKCMLKREVLEVLRGRKVVVYPDNDAFDEWQQKLRSMQDIALFVCKHTPGDTGEKGDIADWMIASPPKSLISSPSPTRRGGAK